MKHLFCSLIIVVILSTICSCAKQLSTTEEMSKVSNESSAVESETLHELSESTSLLLAICIPDHEVMTTLARPYFTKDFLNAWDDITHLPCVETYADYLPDYEWLWYFVQGNGGCEEISAHILKRTIINDSIAEIQVFFTCEDEDWGSNADPEVHIISLVWQNDQWLISDYDNRKQEMIDRVEKDVANYHTYIKYFEIHWDYINEGENEGEIDYNRFEKYKRDMREFIYERENGRHYYNL